MGESCMQREGDENVRSNTTDIKAWIGRRDSLDEDGDESIEEWQCTVEELRHAPDDESRLGLDTASAGDREVSSRRYAIVDDYITAPLRLVHDQNGYREIGRTQDERIQRDPP